LNILLGTQGPSSGFEGSEDLRRGGNHAWQKGLARKGTQSKVLRTGILGRGVIDLLVEAAEAVQRAMRSVDPAEWGERVGIGPDRSPTSVIDRAADLAIREVIEASGEKLNYVSEESEAGDPDAEWTIVVDPVDGTHNAVGNLPDYSVSLAICKGDLLGAQWGLVRNLTNEWTYQAEKGKGAFLNGRRIKVSPYEPGNSLFSLYLGGQAGPKAFELARLCRRVRNLGAASLDMCLVASGSADLYYMETTVPHLELRVTDVAASSLIVREAGGEVYDLRGQRLNMLLDPRERANLFAVGDPSLLEVVL
jgi:fructose-1,6-bisphosphatase/inositol monophosphatase family enzyme